VNWQPVLSPIGNKSITEGQKISFVVSAVDPDGDNLTFEASGLPKGAVFNTTTGMFAWVATYKQIGTHQIKFIVTDDGTPQQSDSEIITIRINKDENSDGGGCFIETNRLIGHDSILKVLFLIFLIFFSSMTKCRSTFRNDNN
jgi:hypothetical protein